MSTLSGNIAGTVRPFLYNRRQVWSHGGADMATLIPIDDLKNKKRRKKRAQAESLDLDEARKKRAKSTKTGDDEWELNGVKGRWRNVQGGPVFFPKGGGEPTGLHPKVDSKPGKSGKADSKGGGGGTAPAEKKSSKKKKTAKKKPVKKKSDKKKESSGGGGSTAAPEGEAPKAGLVKRIFGALKKAFGRGSPDEKAKSGKGGGSGSKSGKSDKAGGHDFSSKSMRKLRQGLAATAANLKRRRKKGGDIPAGAEQATLAMLTAIKANDSKAFDAASKKLQSVGFK